MIIYIEVNHVQHDKNTCFTKQCAPTSHHLAFLTRLSQAHNLVNNVTWSHTGNSD